MPFLYRVFQAKGYVRERPQEYKRHYYRRYTKRWTQMLGRQLLFYVLYPSVLPQDPQGSEGDRHYHQERCRQQRKKRRERRPIYVNAGWPTYKV